MNTDLPVISPLPRSSSILLPVQAPSAMDEVRAVSTVPLDSGSDHEPYEVSREFGELRDGTGTVTPLPSSGQSSLSCSPSINLSPIPSFSPSPVTSSSLAYAETELEVAPDLVRTFISLCELEDGGARAKTYFEALDLQQKEELVAVILNKIIAEQKGKESNYSATISNVIFAISLISAVLIATQVASLYFMSASSLMETLIALIVSYGFISTDFVSHNKYLGSILFVTAASLFVHMITSSRLYNNVTRIPALLDKGLEKLGLFYFSEDEIRDAENNLESVDFNTPVIAEKIMIDYLKKHKVNVNKDDENKKSTIVKGINSAHNAMYLISKYLNTAFEIYIVYINAEKNFTDIMDLASVDSSWLTRVGSITYSSASVIAIILSQLAFNLESEDIDTSHATWKDWAIAGFKQFGTLVPKVTIDLITARHLTPDASKWMNLFYLLAVFFGGYTSSTNNMSRLVANLKPVPPSEEDVGWLKLFKTYIAATKEGMTVAKLINVVFAATVLVFKLNLDLPWLIVSNVLVLPYVLYSNYTTNKAGNGHPEVNASRITFFQSKLNFFESHVQKREKQEKVFALEQDGIVEVMVNAGHIQTRDMDSIRYSDSSFMSNNFSDSDTDDEEAPLVRIEGLGY